MPISVIFDTRSIKSFVPSKFSEFTVKSALIVATDGVPLVNENAPVLVDVGIVSANDASVIFFEISVNAPKVGVSRDIVKFAVFVLDTKSK